MAIILIWLSILAGIMTLFQVTSSLRKAVARPGGASRLPFAAVLFSLISGVLTIASLIASLQQLGFI